MEQTPPGSFIVYSFYRVTPAWLTLPKDEKGRAISEVVAKVEEAQGQLSVRTYSTLGLKRDADFLLWLISKELHPVQALASTLRKTAMGPSLESSHTFLAVTRESTYLKDHGHEVKVNVESGRGKYLFVYPFVKTREWYLLPLEERQKMMNVHIKVGHEFPGIRINTSYGFGLDDQDFMVSFEGDDPKEFVTLVMRLRETEGSRYTQRDTPIFTCVKQPLEEILWSLG